MKTIEIAGAVARFELHRGGIVASVSGVLCHQAHSAIASEMDRRITGMGLVSGVLRLDQIKRMDICPESVSAPFEQIAEARGSSFRPGAFIVRRADMATWLEVSAKAARAGLTIGIFTDAKDGLMYAAGRGESWAAEAEYQARVAAPSELHSDTSRRLFSGLCLR